MYFCIIDKKCEFLLSFITSKKYWNMFLKILDEVTSRLK